MSVANFIPTIWEARLIENYHLRSVAELITTKPLKIEGNKIVFNNVGAVAVKDYTGSVVFDELDTPKVEINMDQKKYWAFKLDDVDATQAAGELVEPHVSEAAATLNEVSDAYVLGAIGLAAGTKIGTAAAPIELTADNAYDKIVDMGTALNKKKAPKNDRYLVVSADVLGLLSKDKRFTPNPVILANGMVEGSNINGFTLVQSEETPLLTAKTQMVGLTKSAFGFGKQLEETEAMRLESSFADGVRGLMVYGAGKLKADGIVQMTYSIG